MAGLTARADGMWQKGVCTGCLAIVLVARVARAQREPYPVDSARIVARVGRESSLVQATYWFAREPRALDLTYLETSCSSVTGVDAHRGDATVSLVREENRPWVVLHDTSDVGELVTGPVAYRLAYRVRHLGGPRLAVPLVQPAGPLDARGARVAAKVQLHVSVAERDLARPEFPRFAEVRPAEWAADLVAVPSSIVMGVRRAAAEPTPCELEIAGANGGFIRRVALFLLTLLLWIPLYFWWAARRRPGADA